MVASHTPWVARGRPTAPRGGPMQSALVMDAEVKGGRVRRHQGHVEFSPFQGEQLTTAKCLLAWPPPTSVALASADISMGPPRGAVGRPRATHEVRDATIPQHLHET